MNYIMRNKLRVFKEKQSFMSVWLLVLLFFLLLLPFKEVYQHYTDTGEWRLDVGGWIMIPVFLYFVINRLHTTIDQDGVEITFFPFAWRKRWYWHSIAEVSVRKYNLIEFGGWGYRLGKNGVAYTCKGRYGIQIKLRSGRKLLIGTQCPEQAQEILTKIKEND